MKIAILSAGKYTPDHMQSIHLKYTHFILQVLQKQGHDVHVLSLLKKKYNYKDDVVRDIQKEKHHINDYDIMIVESAGFYRTYYGGEVNPVVPEVYYSIAHFDKKIYYICDDLLSSVLLLPQGERFFQLTKLDKKDYDISNKTFHLITQFRDLDKVKEVVQKSVPWTVGEVIHFPISMYALYVDNKHYGLPDELPSLADKEFDLVFGSGWRAGKRKDDMIKYYSGYPENYRIYLFGKGLEKSKIVNATYGKSVVNDAYLLENARGIATIVIGDGFQKEVHNIPGRIFETVKANVITFIDKSLDPDMTFFKNEKLKKFLYVESREDVIKRLEMIKNDEKLYHNILIAQKKDMTIPLEKFEIKLTKD